LSNAQASSATVNHGDRGMTGKNWQRGNAPTSRH